MATGRPRMSSLPDCQAPAGGGRLPVPLPLMLLLVLLAWLFIFSAVVVVLLLFLLLFVVLLVQEKRGDYTSNCRVREPKGRWISSCTSATDPWARTPPHRHQHPHASGRATGGSVLGGRPLGCTAPPSSLSFQFPACPTPWSLAETPRESPLPPLLQRGGTDALVGQCAKS